MIYKLFEENEIYQTLTRGEQTIYDYLAQNWQNSSLMKIQNIANNCYCSTTSVQRLVRKLGFASFSEFKIKAINEGQNQTNLINSFNIEETFNQINEATMFPIIEQIRSHNHIYIYGTGASEISSRFLVRQLMLLGFHAAYINDIHLLKNIRTGLFIPISSSGSTRLIINASLRAKNNNLTICAITKKNSLLEQIANYSFTHNVIIRDLDYIEREMQLHLFIMISQIIDHLRYQLQK